MMIAIVGSRNWNDPKAIHDYVKSLPKNAIVISGGAKGVDTEVYNAAKTHGIAILVFFPDYETYGPKLAPLMRNGKIVECGEKVVAFWDGTSRGTLDAITKAKVAGKPVEIISPK